jgi:hypothetical protein
MRYLFGFLCVCALGLMPLVGCSDDATGDGGSGGTVAAGCDLGLGLCYPFGICDDDDPCTKDLCSGADGACRYVEQCDDFNDCTTEMCDPADGSCSTQTPVADGTSCAGGACQSGVCVLSGTVLPCTEQGIRNAIAAGDDTYTFDCDGTAPVVTQDEILIHNNVILDGEGKLTVDGNCDHRVLTVPEGEDVTAELSGFTVVRGASANGGCIRNDGTLTLRNSTVSRCSALGIPSDFADSRGGGIFNAGTLTVSNSTVSGSSGSFAGGGISNFGALTLTDSTLSGNSAEVGGGLWNDNTFTITNSTVSGNAANNTTFTAGGGIHNDQGSNLPRASSITNSTVSGNTGRGVYSSLSTSTLTLTNSVVDGDCSAPLTSNGYNIESPGNTCGFDPDGTDQVSVTEGQLKLGELADNGGPTMTHALGADSVAINKIPAVDCEVDKDQRGQPRPETGGTMCDVGSVEVQPPPAEGCIQSGGTVSTGLCCQAVESFPNTCTIGACGCAPDSSHEVAVCICPANTCFDGESCVAQ